MLLLTIFAIFCAGVSLTDMLKLHILVNSDEASILDQFRDDMLNTITQQIHDVVSTSIRRRRRRIDVLQTLKQRRVSTGKVFYKMIDKSGVNTSLYLKQLNFQPILGQCSISIPPKYVWCFLEVQNLNNGSKWLIIFSQIFEELFSILTGLKLEISFLFFFYLRGLLRQSMHCQEKIY